MMSNNSLSTTNTTILTTTNTLTSTTMKTQVKNNRFRSTIRKAALTLIAAIAVAATQVTFAGTGPEPAVTTSLQSTVFQLPNSMKFKTVVATGQNSKLYVIIRNEKNEPIYTESLKSTNGYIRTFDFSTLADGEYTFEISNGKQTQSKTFKIETSTERIVKLD